MFWQPQLFITNPFSRPLLLGQASGTCAISPDGTTACPPAEQATAEPTGTSLLVPIALGGAAVLAAIFFLK